MIKPFGMKGPRTKLKPNIRKASFISGYNKYSGQKLISVPAAVIHCYLNK